MSDRPYTTLFLLVSVDGKISTGDTDVMDVDSDYPGIKGLREGLKQYYDLESETDLFSLNTGRVFAKIGFNQNPELPVKSPVTFVVVDSKPHLTKSGVSYLANKAKELIVVTTKTDHPANALKREFNNIHVLEYDGTVDFSDLFSRLKRDFGAERVTVQSGGTLNTTLVRECLIDRVVFVVAPALIGGRTTPTSMDGESLHTLEDLPSIKTLKLVRTVPLEDSYVLLEYAVRNS